MTLRRQSREARHSAVAAAFSHAINSSPSPSIISGASNQQNSKTADGESEADMQSPLEHWPFMEALQNKRPVLVEDCSALLENFPVRVWDELPNAAIVVPVSTESDDGIPSSVVVLGLSVRRPFDDDYEAFVVSALSQTFKGVLQSAHAPLAACFWHYRSKVLRSRETTDRGVSSTRSRQGQESLGNENHLAEGAEFVILERQPRASHPSDARRRAAGRPACRDS